MEVASNCPVLAHEVSVGVPVLYLETRPDTHRDRERRRSEGTTGSTAIVDIGVTDRAHDQLSPWSMATGTREVFVRPG